MTKYTGQWTQRAKLSPITRGQQNKVVDGIKSGNLNIERIAGMNTMSQFGILVSMWGAALEGGMTMNDSLAENILYKLATSIRNYGKNAYSISERQVQVIWNHLSKWLRVEAIT